MQFQQGTTPNSSGAITTRKEVKGNDRMDHRNVPDKRHLGTRVYRGVHESRGKEVTCTERKLDSEENGQTRVGMGHARPTDSRQEEEFVFSNQTRVGSSNTTSTFALTMQPDGASTAPLTQS